MPEVSRSTAAAKPVAVGSQKFEVESTHFQQELSANKQFAVFKPDSIRPLIGMPTELSDNFSYSSVGHSVVTLCE